ncbi:MAG: 50S ribosomal protein L32 [Trueperaceae bacterium]|nr:50S ribosomal protein L32 [Trueperaceae bacterium]
MAKHPVPKKRMSRSARDTRRAHDALTAPTLVACPQCKEMKPPHQVCPHCGTYKGKEVLTIEV